MTEWDKHAFRIILFKFKPLIKHKWERLFKSLWSQSISTGELIVWNNVVSWANSNSLENLNIKKCYL